MTPEEIRELWSRFTAGQDLSDEEQRALVAALESDPDLRGALVENLQLDGMLRELGALRRNGDAFVRSLQDCIGREHDATRFIQKVELRLGDSEPPTPPSSSGPSRGTKPPTTRIYRRHPASPPGETAWKPALIAAALFVTALLLLATSGEPARKPSAAAKGRAPVAPAEPVAPPAPVPAPRPAAPDHAEELRRLRQLADLERERERLRTAPPAPDEKPGDRQRALAANDDERRHIEEELRTVVPGRGEPPRPRTTPPVPGTATAPVAAAGPVMEKVDGFVYVVRSRADIVPARKGEAVPAGCDVETKAGTVTLRYDDDTTVELGAQSAFTPAGRRLFLKSGSLRSKIAKQAAGRPLVFATPQAEAAILGTTIRLATSADPKIGSSLEVQEGRVRFTRLADEKSVDVAGGQFATAAVGLELAPQKAFPDEILVKFGPYDPLLKPGQYLDLGDEFTAARGYGWIGAGGEVIGEWTNSAGQKEVLRSGRQQGRRTTSPDVDPLKATDIVAGWTGHYETWVMPVPNGRYAVRVCCGDASFEQGPHHVWVEGKQIINEKKNRAGGWVEGEDVVEVRDGELTMRVGGNPGPRKSGDGSTDTLINFLVLRKLRK